MIIFTLYIRVVAQKAARFSKRLLLKERIRERENLRRCIEKSDI